MMRSRRPLSLTSAITLWFAVLHFVLYAAAMSAVVALDIHNRRQEQGVYVLGKADALATYYAATGKLDFPELADNEYADLALAPPTTWLRLMDAEGVLAASPGIPKVPVESAPGAPSGTRRLLEAPDGGVLVSAIHQVWNRPGVWVEALSPRVGFDAQSWRLTLALATLGVLLLPLVAGAGRLLAARALSPVDRLLQDIRSMDFGHLEQRLDPRDVPGDIAQLVDEFNAVLDRLEIAVDRMRRFTADASHELRTPISVLRTGLEVTLKRERSVEEYRELLAENLVEIDRIQRVVEGLLTLARDPTGRESPPPSLPLDLSRVTREALTAMTVLARERRVRLLGDLEPKVTVAGDPDRLRLMIVNLLDNAIKYTPSGKSVKIRLEAREDGSARLVVADQGRGIAPEDRDRVFDRFYRGAHPAAGPKVGGIGLSVARWVVESHRGSIGILDEPGWGAVFEVTLPRVSPLDANDDAAEPDLTTTSRREGALA